MPVTQFRIGISLMHVRTHRTRIYGIWATGIPQINNDEQRKLRNIFNEFCHLGVCECVSDCEWLAKVFQQNCSSDFVQLKCGSPNYTEQFEMDTIWMRAFSPKNNLLDEVYRIPLAHVSINESKCDPNARVVCIFIFNFLRVNLMARGMRCQKKKNETCILSGDPVAIVCCVRTMLSAINSYFAIALYALSHIYWPIKCKWMQPHSLSGSFAIGCSKNVERIEFWFFA